MNRRGFLSKLNLFKEEPGEMLFYGVQVVVNTGSDDHMRSKIHNVINAPMKEETPHEKKAFYKKIVSLILEQEPFFEYGHWDYLTNAADAKAEFNDWVQEIEGSLASEAEETGEAIDEQFRMSSDKQYVVLSMAFLLENNDSHSNFFEMIDLPESEYFIRDTWPKLLKAIGYIDFEFALADAVFIMPGNEKDGFSFEDLHSEGWEYLKPIS